MTDKYDLWIAHLARRDELLFKLALVSMGAVLAWELLRFMPPAWAARLRPLYMLGCLMVLAGTVAVIFIGSGGTP